MIFFKAMKKNIFLVTMFLTIFFPAISLANHFDVDREGDSDHDGLLDAEEFKYGTDRMRSDSDNDGYLDGEEVGHGYDPLMGSGARFPKRIEVDLSEQRLRYFYGEYGEQGNFLISSGLRSTPTPVGTFNIQKKKPTVNYGGRGYSYPNTKWNLQFMPRYYIHGAYWHNNFGKPMSHGCVNVDYKNMEKLYEFADEGTEVQIHY